MQTRNNMLGLAALAMSLFSGTALAGCVFVPGSNTVDRTVPLIGSNITVSRDVPVGTVLFKQEFNSSTSTSTVSCEPGIYNKIRSRTLTSTPLPLSSWSGANAGKVYESGVPGIGVYLFSEGEALPDDNSFGNCGGGTAFCITSAQIGFDVVFIKTGNVSPGTIQGASLPSMQNDWISPDGTTIILQRVGFTGTLNVVARTCITPDVNVPLDRHSVSEFSGVGTGTPWKSFQISLNNCPAFNGTFPGSPAPKFDATGDVSTEQGRRSNVIGYRLDPTDGVIDANQGIISLTPSPSGFLPAATGIGIQIGSDDAVPIPVQLSTVQSSGIVTAATEGASYVIPLKARYIQTTTAMTGGPANGAVVFTIDYQ